MLLQKWRDTTKHMLPNQPDLLLSEKGRLPKKSQLMIAKLGKGDGVMTDGCNKACKECKIVA